MQRTACECHGNFAFTACLAQATDASNVDYFDGVVWATGTVRSASL